LAAKLLPPDMIQIKSPVIQAVNCIKFSALNSRIFNKRCSVMDGKSAQLLVHSEVRRLSKGKVLKRMHDLHEELAAFFSNKEVMEFKD
jgi:hypothetical protein